MDHHPINSNKDFSSFLDRRNFLRSSVITGAGLLLTSKGAIAQKKDGVVSVAIVGCGAQGFTLFESMRMIEGGYRIDAVCDIIDLRAKRMAGSAKAYKIGEPNIYKDFNELLDKETNLDAVFVATPDFLHAPFSIKVLEKGLACYCEKMMSNTIEGAQSMVRAGAKSSKPFQLGHQRRSNPRYLNLRNNIMHGEELLGRVTHAYGQWNRAVGSKQVWKGAKSEKALGITEAELNKFGYENGDAYMNWRWYKKYGAGPISDLGAHQIDLFNWFFKTKPKSVIAAGGVDYYEGSEVDDNVMAIYEYEYPSGKTARAYYQVLTTTGSGGFYEKWMGEDATAVMSELDTNGNQLYRESRATKNWEPLVKKGLITSDSENIYNRFWEHPKTWPGPHSAGLKWKDTKNVADTRISKDLEAYELGVNLTVRPHTDHVRNFLDSVRADDPSLLNCSVQTAYETCVTVLTINQSIKSGAKVEFKPSDFVVA